MKPFIRALLRVSVCQLRFLEKIPVSAAVNEAVNLAKARGFSPLSGFVNAVLRSIAREPQKPLIPSYDKAPQEWLSLTYSYPLWLIEALTEWLGAKGAYQFCEGSHPSPAVTVMTNVMKISPEALAKKLSDEGLTCIPGSIHLECLHLRHTADISRLASFTDGYFQVMDEGAFTAVKAVNPQPGQRIADLCAAPGGKAIACACLMNDSGWVDAFDFHAHKIALLQETIARLGLHSVQAAVNDASLPMLAESGYRADAVLLDVPCSGLGIIRKRPDIKYTRRPEDIMALAEKQRQMLAMAADLVKPGGTLVYCTCTIAREENIENIRWFIERYPFTVDSPENWGGLPLSRAAEGLPADSTEAASPRYWVEEQCLQLLPGKHNDGFFIARMVKTKELLRN